MRPSHFSLCCIILSHSSPAYLLEQDSSPARLLVAWYALARGSANERMSALELAKCGGGRRFGSAAVEIWFRA